MQYLILTNINDIFFYIYKIKNKPHVEFYINLFFIFLIFFLFYVSASFSFFCILLFFSRSLFLLLLLYFNNINLNFIIKIREFQKLISNKLSKYKIFFLDSIFLTISLNLDLISLYYFFEPDVFNTYFLYYKIFFLINSFYPIIATYFLNSNKSIRSFFNKTLIYFALLFFPIIFLVISQIIPIIIPSILTLSLSIIIMFMLIISLRFFAFYYGFLLTIKEFQKERIFIYLIQIILYLIIIFVLGTLNNITIINLLISNIFTVFIVVLFFKYLVKKNHFYEKRN